MPHLVENEKITEMADAGEIKFLIVWEGFRSDLNRVHEQDRKSKAEAKPLDVMLVFKVLLQ